MVFKVLNVYFKHKIEANDLNVSVQQLVGLARRTPEVQAGLEGLGRDQPPVRLLARTGEWHSTN